MYSLIRRFKLCVCAGIISIIIIYANLSVAQTAQDGQSVDNLKLIVIGLKNSDGDVSIALDNSKETYLSREGHSSFRKARTKVRDKRAEYIFENIPFGDYTIKLYHDENANGKLDTNFLGIPNEAFGFSNNARGTFGPPAFEKAKFSFSKKNKVHRITLK